MLKYQVVRLDDCIFYCRYHTYHRKNSPAYICDSGYMTWDEYGTEKKSLPNLEIMDFSNVEI